MPVASNEPGARVTPGGEPAPSPHVPVMLAEVIAAAALTHNGIAIDGTFGAGGYSRALAEAGARVIALDRDPTAIAAGRPLAKALGDRLTLVEARFSELDRVARDLGFHTVDAVVLDIGVSSMQLDRPERGFSFRADGPLDMRMGASGPTAADLVATLAEKPLADLIYRFGEERASRAIARAIVKARAEAAIVTTGRLAEIVAGVVRTKPGDIHPATRTFQALRIAVNDELDELTAALEAAERILRPGGRLVVVSFHSLEDRIVKDFLNERSGRTDHGSRHRPGAARPAPTFSLLTRKPVIAGPAETSANPRARSAKLRAAARTDQPMSGA